MNTKRHLWIWMAIVAVTLGSFGTGLLWYRNSIAGNSFPAADFGPSFLFFSSTTFFVLWLLGPFFKLVRGFLRWFFTGRALRRSLRVLGFLLVAITLFYAEEDWRGKHAWEKYKQEWEARGEKFDFASFIPPPVPDDQNFALTPVMASCYARFVDKNGHRKPQEDTNAVNRLEMFIYPDYTGEGAPTNGDWEKGQITDLKAWQTFYRTSRTSDVDKYRPTNEFEIPPIPQSPAEDVLLALSKFSSTIEAVRQAGKLPCSRFPIDYDVNQPLNPLLFHLPALRNCADVLELRATAELELGRQAQALDDVKLELRLADSLRNEPFLISHLVRARLLIMTLQPIVDGLAKHQWSDADLAELDADLKKLDLLADLQFALRGERAAMLATVEDFRSVRNYRTYAGYPDNFFSWNWGTASGAAAFYLIPDGWFYQLELTIAKTCQSRRVGIVDPTRHLAFPKKEIDVGEIELVVRPWPLWRADAMYLAELPPERRIIHVQESIDMARVACALERYRLALGRYPETLDILPPRFIEAIPHDIIGGQPLHYHRTDNGSFILYSIGWNEKDDAGQYSKSETDGQLNWSDGDWVWPSPAK